MPTTEVATEPLFAYLAPFDRTTELVLTPAPNGGWTIRARGPEYCVDNILGAFSSSEDLLTALGVALDIPK